MRSFSGRANCRNRVTSELVRSTSVEMKPGHFARHFVLRAELLVQHFGRRLDGAQRIAQLVRQARGELAQRRQSVGAPHGFVAPACT